MSQPVDAHFQHLGPFSDFVAVARSLAPLFPQPASPAEARRSARDVLHFTSGDEQPRDVQVGRRWEAGGIAGEEVSWSVGYGPRTHGWVLKPSAADTPLAGVLALHCHGDNKILGKEKIADGPDGPAAGHGDYRDGYYGGRAYVDVLAREGFVVLVHDTFLWSSRRFPLEVMPERELVLADAIGATLDQEAAGPEVVRYNGAAYLHEHLVEKYCTVLGTSFAAVVAYEDRVALNYLRARPDVDARRLGCVGLSGGGSRAALLRATTDHLAACAIAGMMSTYDGLIDHCIAPHTWMFFPSGWSRHGDWPDLASSGAPAPLLVQYLLDDAQFTVSGMRDAHARIARTYTAASAPDNYVGEFYPGPHRFDVAMQDMAFAWLRQKLAR
jgi:dienelactone hydrolase